MFCPKCGSSIDHDHSYCSQCGCSLEDWGVIHDSPDEVHTASKKQRGAGWFYLLAFFAFIMMLWGGYALITGADTLSTIARSQLEQIKTNKLTKAYYENTSSVFRKEKTLEEFKKFIEKNPSLKDYLKVAIVKSEMDKKYGVVFLNLILPNDGEVKVKFEFVEEEGEWRILGISTEEPVHTDQEKEKTEAVIMEAVKAHLEAIRKEELDKAYGMGADEFKKVTKPEGFKEFIKEYPILSTDKATSMSLVEHEGNKALVRVLLYSNGVPVPIDYIMVFEDGIWKVWGFYVLTPNDTEEHEGEVVQNESVSEPIEGFLKDLQLGKVEQAYKKAAQKFQTTTSLEKFKEFLKTYPFFQEGEGSSVKSKVRGDIGQVRYLMKNGDKEAKVDFILTKEDGKWKVLGVHFVDDYSSSSKIEKEGSDESADFDSTLLTKVISEQLKQIREKDLYSAYEDYTSKKFRESTPFENFAGFMEQNRIFSGDTSEKFGKLNFDNNIASITVNLISKDGTSTQVEYELVKEDNDWKVLSIKILNPSESEENPSKEETQ